MTYLSCKWWAPGKVIAWINPYRDGHTHYSAGRCMMIKSGIYQPTVDIGCFEHEPLDSAHEKAERLVALELFNLPKGAYGKEGPT